MKLHFYNVENLYGWGYVGFIIASKSCNTYKYISYVHISKCKADDSIILLYV